MRRTPYLTLILFLIAACGQGTAANVAQPKPTGSPALPYAVYFNDTAVTDRAVESGIKALRLDGQASIQALPGGSPLDLFSTSEGKLLALRNRASEGGRRELSIEEYDPSAASLRRTVYRTELDIPERFSGQFNSFWFDGALAPDESSLYLFLELRTAESAWHSRMDVIDLEKGVRTARVSLGELNAYSQWLEAHPTTDGRLLLMRSLSTGTLPHNALVGFDLLLLDPLDGRVVWRRQSGGSEGLLGCGWEHWISPDGRFLTCTAFATDKGQQRLYARVVDLPRWDVLGEVPLPYAPRTQEDIETGWLPHEFVYAPDGRYLYYVRPDEDPAVIKVDLAQARIAGRLSLPTATTWRAVPIESHGRSFTDGVLEALLRLVATPAEAKGAVVLNVEAVVSPDGRRLYFTGLTDKASLRIIASTVVRRIRRPSR